MMKRGVVACIAALALGLSGCSLASGEPDAPESAALELPTGLNPEPGIDIPEETLKVAFTPMGNELIGVIGAKRGYFEDAGISFTEPNGLKVNLSESFTPLLNGQVEVGSGYMPALAPQLDTVSNVRGFALSNVFLGNRILAPEGKYATVDDLMAQGQSFEEAAVTVMEQLRGQKLLMPDGTSPTFYNLALGQAGMTLDDIEPMRMSGPDIVRAAQAGEAEFAAPEGAVQQTQLQGSGWEPLLTIGQLIEAMPEETTDLQSTHSTYFTTTEFAQENYNTLLRFTSVIYRIIDDLEKDPKGASADFTDYLNSYAGSDLSVEEVARMFTEGLYELRGFDEAGGFVGDNEELYNLRRAAQAQIETLRSGGVLTKDHTVDDMDISSKVYQDLVAYRDAADDALAEAPESELKAQAQEYYDSFNYLDAYRLALAAGDGQS